MWWGPQAGTALRAWVSAACACGLRVEFQGWRRQGFDQEGGGVGGRGSRFYRNLGLGFYIWGSRWSV
jgi:hypothetical protein